MLYNNSKSLLDSISKVVSEDRKKYQEDRDQLEGKLQMEAMSKMKMEYVVPEEIEKEGVAHFMGAAAAAHKAGKKEFAFGGKNYPVKIKPQIAKQVNEKLIGNQHKIDANKNGKVDAHDFKLLRKEETNISESHFKVGDEVKCKASGMEGEVVKIDKPETGKYYTVKREDGKTMKYAPDELVKEKEKEEVQEASKDQETQFHSKLDKLVHKTFGKRANESVQIDELSKKTLGSYAKKASVDMANKSSDATAKRTMAGADYAYNISRGMSAKTADAHMKKDREAAQPDVKKAVQRFRGIEKAVNRLAKEELEHVEEATITQGANKGKQWSPSTTGPTNKVKPSTKDLPAPMDGATAPPPKSMKKEGVMDNIGSAASGAWNKFKSAMQGASPVGSSASYGSTNYGKTTSGWSGGGVSGSPYRSATGLSTSSSSSTPGSMADYLTGKKPLTGPKTEQSDIVKKIAGKIKKAVAPEVKPVKMKEEIELSEAAQKDTPGQHMCAVHVKHRSFGEGKTLTTQHAEPAADGSIAWYDVMFEHGIEKQVPTSDLEIILAETHTHSKDKK